MKIVRSITALLLALLVLVSSTNLSWSLHICMGKVKSFALFSAADPCSMEDSDLEEMADFALSGQNCCEDQTIVVEAHEQLSTSGPSDLFKSFEFVALYSVLSYLVLQPASDVDSYAEYSPPLISRDIPVLTQSFLI